MSAFLSTTITLKDVESFEQYGAKAAAIIAEHGGEVVLVGSVAKVLVGQADHHYEVVIRFPDVATIEAFYGSVEYQALIPLRDKGADVVFKVIQEEV